MRALPLRISGGVALPLLRRKTAWRAVPFLAGLFFAVASPTAILRAEGATTQELLSDLAVRFEAAYERSGKALRQLNLSFGEALERLQDELAGSGDLDAVLAVKKEIEAFGDGSSFSRPEFEARVTTLPALQRLKSTYLLERERLEKKRENEARPLVRTYLEELDNLESRQTRARRIEDALLVRQAREEFEKDPRFHAGTGVLAPFDGRILFLGKGEYEVSINGKRISFHNAAERSEVYRDATGRPQQFQLGDVITIRMRSPHVYRSFIFAIQSEKGDIGLPFRWEDYRLISEDVDLPRATPEAIRQLPTRIEPAGPDSEMGTFWQDRDIDPKLRSAAEWVKVGQGDDWFTCAVVLTADMIVRLEPDR